MSYFKALTGWFSLSCSGLLCAPFFHIFLMSDWALALHILQTRDVSLKTQSYALSSTLIQVEVFSVWYPTCLSFFHFVHSSHLVSLINCDGYLQGPGGNSITEGVAFCIVCVTRKPQHVAICCLFSI